MPARGDADVAGAMAAAQRGELARAIDLLARALRRDPRNAALWFNRASLLQQRGRAAEAIADYDRALALNAADAEAWFNRAVACETLNALDGALTSYDRALRIQPGHRGARNNRAVLLARLGRHADALAMFQAALKRDPADAKAHYNAANALRALDRRAEALAHYDRALALDPAHADSATNRALCLAELERPDAALAGHEYALRLGETPARLYNKGAALLALGRAEEAIAAFDAALRLRPEMPEARLSKSFALLALGRFAEGWPLYEARWDTPGAPAKPEIEAPLWLGREDIAGKAILLHAEQGLGDTIQFCRYAPALTRRGARVVFRVQPPLKHLFGETLSGIELIGTDEPPPAVEYWTPLLSLPLALGVTAETIQTENPYLRADRARAAAWAERLPPGPRIGLAWRGDCTTAQRRRRAIPLPMLAPLLARPAHFVSLQIDLDAAERPVIERFGISHFGEAIRDFREQAALTAACDLVISIDTGAAHLAGALGRPLHLMLPTGADFRWMIGREDSPWLPTARLYRQTAPGDWTDVIARVGAALDAALATRRI